MCESASRDGEILAQAARARADVAPESIRALTAQLDALAHQAETTRRAVEIIRSRRDIARERLARLEAAELALQSARVRLQALEAAGPALASVRSRVHSLSPSVEAARRALEATPSTMLPEARRQVRALATEIDAAARTVETPATLLERLGAQVQALEALGPVLAAAHEEVAMLDAVSSSLEATRRQLREFVTELEGPRRALDSVMRSYP